MKRFFILLFFFIVNHAMAQPLPLQDAINIALKNSLDIQLSKNNVTANTILNNYGVAGGLPFVSTNLVDQEHITSINQKYSDPTRDTKRNNAASNNITAGVDGSFLLYNGMRVIAAKHRLATLEAQSEKQLNGEVQNMIALVMTGYYDILRQQGYLKTIQQSIDVSKQKLVIVQTQQSVGLANNADLFQAQLDLNASEQALQAQQLVIDQAKTELLRLMNLKSDSSVVIEDTILVDKDLKLETVTNNLSRNADIMAAGDQIKINEYLVKETAALRYPSISVSSGYDYGRTKSAAGFSLLNQSYGPYVGVGISIPLYNGTVYKREQRVAEINTSNAVLQQKVLVRDYTASVVKNYQAYQNTLQQLDTQQRNFELAQRLVDLVLQRFQLRVATIVDVKNAQQSFEDAGYRLINLSFAAKAAEIELKRLANVLTF